MRAMITGIGGSIGCHVFAHIMEKTDWHVVGIDSFRHKGLTDRVYVTLNEHPEWAARLTLITHDLAAPLSPIMEEKIGEIDFILNLASLSDVWASIADPVPCITNNVQLELNILEYARRANPRVFLQVSTDEVYGPTDGASYHKEWDPIVPSNPYSASKAAQEVIAIAYWRSYNVPLIIVNLMNNFGEMQSPAKFPVIVQRALVEGEPVRIHGSREEQGSRFYIHSRNSADAFLFLLQNTEPHIHVPGDVDKPDRYNIVGDRQITNLGLAVMIAGFLNVPLNVIWEPFTEARPGHDRHYGLDGTKLHQLGWKSPVNLLDSMRKTVEWQEEHPEWLMPHS